jgi:hypothetical protein
VTGDWRRLHDEELHNLYTTPNSVRVIKSRCMRLTRHVEFMGKIKNEHNILVEKTGAKRPRKIILEWILGKVGGKVWTGFRWLRIGISGGILCTR